MASPALLVGAPEDLVALRDLFAIQALQAMVIAGGWGYTDKGGTRHTYNSMPEYAEAAYEFADVMLKAREVRRG
ncbi:hypothetical protein [Pseudomonas sp. PDM18]|uniref:hypothetical protein n=1 Tax=Pseudomonas sp. PDM18 TaxID=2769253 RepID=UPI001CE131FA|nr:hypothetical protein [Pseudomonas sp. PDM18]